MLVQGWLSGLFQLSDARGAYSDEFDYMPNDFERFSYNPEQNNSIVAVLDNGEVAVFSNNDFNNSGIVKPDKSFGFQHK